MRNLLKIFLPLIFLIILSYSISADLTSGRQLFLNFNNNLNDQSGNGNDFTSAGVVYTSSYNDVGIQITWGNTNYVYKDSSDICVGNTTIMFMIYWNNTVDGGQDLFGNYKSDLTGSYMWSTNGVEPRIGTYVTAVGWVNTAKALLVPNVWVPVAIIHNMTNVLLYVNGTSVDNITISTPVLNQSYTRYSIGERGSTNSNNPLTAIYDNFMCFNQIKTDADVYEYYKTYYLNDSGAPKDLIFVTPPENTFVSSGLNISARAYDAEGNTLSYYTTLEWANSTHQQCEHTGWCGPMQNGNGTNWNETQFTWNLTTLQISGNNTYAKIYLWANDGTTNSNNITLMLNLSEISKPEINWASFSPTNNTASNKVVLEFYFNVTHKLGNVTNCYLYRNITEGWQEIDNMIPTTLNTTQHLDYNTELQNNTEFVLSCTDGVNWGNTSTKSIWIDRVNPVINSYYPNNMNTSIILANFSWNITCDDDNLFEFEINVTDCTQKDNILYYYQDTIPSTSFTYGNLTDFLIFPREGEYCYQVKCGDSHTLNEIGSLTDIDTNIKNSNVKLKKDKINVNFNLQNIDSSIQYDETKVNKDTEKYKIGYKFKKIGTKINNYTTSMLINSSLPIKLINSKIGHFVIGDKFSGIYIDYTEEIKNGNKLNIRKINDYQYIVDINHNNLFIDPYVGNLNNKTYSGSFNVSFIPDFNITQPLLNNSIKIGNYQNLEITKNSTYISSCDFSFNGINVVMELFSSKCNSTIIPADGGNYVLNFSQTNIYNQTNWKIFNFTENELPNITDISIRDIPLYSNTSTNVTYNYSDTEPANNIEFQWYINNTLNVTTPDISYTNYHYTYRVKASARAFDGYEWSGWFNSTQTTVLSSPPLIGYANFSNPFYKFDNLTAYYNFTSFDNGNDRSSKKWYVDGILVSENHTNYIINSSYPKNVLLSVQAYDGISNGNTVNYSANMSLKRANITGLYPVSGEYSDFINVQCAVDNSEDSLFNYTLYAYYDNGTGTQQWYKIYSALGINYYIFDVTQLPTQSGVDLNCTVENSIGLFSSINPYGTLSIKDDGLIGLLYPTNLGKIYTYTKYTLGLVCDIPKSYDYKLFSAFADCNSDGLTDYWWDLNDTNTTNIKKWFNCLEKEAKTTEISAGCVLWKNNRTSIWQKPFCEGLASDYDMCRYQVNQQVVINE